jgi:hypothetical protein
LNAAISYVFIRGAPPESSANCHWPTAAGGGRLVRFDPILLRRSFSGRQSGSGNGKSLGKEAVPIPGRYQQGYVKTLGKQTKVWYGWIREDFRKKDGTLERKQRKIRLGTKAEPKRTQPRTYTLVLSVRVFSQTKTGRILLDITHFNRAALLFGMGAPPSPLEHTKRDWGA